MQMKDCVTLSQNTRMDSLRSKGVGFGYKSHPSIEMETQVPGGPCSCADAARPALKGFHCRGGVLAEDHEIMKRTKCHGRVMASLVL